MKPNRPIWIIQRPNLCSPIEWVDTAMKARMAQRNGCFITRVDKMRIVRWKAKKKKEKLW